LSGFRSMSRTSGYCAELTGMTFLLAIVSMKSLQTVWLIP